jgi:hypothetical protein
VVADIPKEPAPFVFSFCPHQSRFGFGFLHGFVKEANSAKLALNLHHATVNHGGTTGF